MSPLLSLSSFSGEGVRSDTRRGERERMDGSGRWVDQASGNVAREELSGRTRVRRKESVVGRRVTMPSTSKCWMGIEADECMGSEVGSPIDCCVGNGIRWIDRKEWIGSSFRSEKRVLDLSSSSLSRSGRSILKGTHALRSTRLLSRMNRQLICQSFLECLPGEDRQGQSNGTP